jgi:hypothetical protein
MILTIIAMITVMTILMTTAAMMTHTAPTIAALITNTHMTTTILSLKHVMIPILITLMTLTNT